MLVRAMGQGLGVLASIGSAAPFVGLFGTVWGIMNSFIGIAASQSTTLRRWRRASPKPCGHALGPCRGDTGRGDL